MTKVQLILELLKTRGDNPLDSRSIARECNFKPSGLNQILNELSRRKLLLKTPITYKLSPLGQRWLEKKWAAQAKLKEQEETKAEEMTKNPIPVPNLVPEMETQTGENLTPENLETQNGENNG